MLYPFSHIFSRGENVLRNTRTAKWSSLLGSALVSPSEKMYIYPLPLRPFWIMRKLSRQMTCLHLFNVLFRSRQKSLHHIPYSIIFNNFAGSRIFTSFRIFLWTYFCTGWSISKILLIQREKIIFCAGFSYSWLCYCARSKIK